MRRRLNLLLLFVCIGMMSHAQDHPGYPAVGALAEVEVPARDRVQLARELLGVGAIPAPPAEPVQYAIGDRRMFSVNDNATNVARQVEAELAALGRHIALWVDVRVVYSRQRAEAFVREFDSGIYGPMRALWGGERTPGIDGDSRVVALFAIGVSPGIAAYYASDHSLPRAVVPHSNEAEMMIYSLDAYGIQFDSRPIISVTVHEFQHMIRDNIDSNTQTWLNEGMSIFSEWMIGYSSVDSVFAGYFNRPDTQLNTWASGGAHYGAADLFVTYFYERFGTDGIDALGHASGLDMALVDAALAEIDAGIDSAALFADWAAANWLQLEGTIYGYRDVRTHRPAHQVVAAYPVSLEERAAPYSTDYFRLDDLPAGGTLRLSLALDGAVGLIPAAASSGEQMWIAVRQDDSAPTLTRAFDLRGVDSASLDYSVWYDLESNYDFGYLTVSSDGGRTWRVLSTPDMRDSLYGAGYTGRSAGWVKQSVSLDDDVGSEILVRFMVVTDDALTNPGIAIDDIRLDALGYASDFEASADGWDARGWLLTDNRLPAQAWVQVLQRRPGRVVDVHRMLVGPSGQDVDVHIHDDALSVAVAVSPIVPLMTGPLDYTLDIAAD